MKERLQKIILIKHYLRTVEESMHELAGLLLELELEAREGIAREEKEDSRGDLVDSFFEEIYKMCGYERKGTD